MKNIIAGFAIFSIFFGAGNLLFPPSLGMQTSYYYPYAIIGFFITAIVIPLLTLVLTAKYDGDYIKFYSLAGKTFGIIIATITFLIIGPIIAMPRTANVALILGINPIIKITDYFIYATIIYFILALLFALNKSSLIETLGKVLTPVLIVSLLVFIILGLFGKSNFSPVYTNNPFLISLKEGYNTLDGLSGAFISALVWNNIKEKLDKNNMKRSMFFSILITGSILFVIYSGLIYLGAKYSNILTSNTEIIITLGNIFLGKFLIVLLIAIIFACFTTTIGLLAIGGELIEKITKGKIKYSFACIIITIVSIIMSTMGLNKIITVSVPFLLISYPAVITLIFLGLFDHYFTKLEIKIITYLVFISSIITYFFKLHDLIWIFVLVCSILIIKIISRFRSVYV